MSRITFRRTTVLFFSLLIFALNSLHAVRLDQEKIFIGDKFYYWPAPLDSTFGDAMSHSREFKKLEDRTSKNLERTLGRNGQTVWIRADFTIPESMRGMAIGLVIPYLRFAEMLWINGTFVSMSGNFPPKEQSTLYKSHFFNFPPSVLNPEGNNQIMIKVWSHGQSAISCHSYIKCSQFAFSEASKINFLHTKIYMYFIGGLVFAFCLYLILFLTRKKDREHLDFSLLNLFTILLLTPFYAPELPWYNDNSFPYILFMKLTLCLPLYWIFYFITNFIIDFEHSRQIPLMNRVRFIFVISQCIITLAAPDYDTLMDITVIMGIFTLLQLSFGLYIFVRNLLIKRRRKTAIIQFLGFSPVLVSILIDLILRIRDNTQVYPFFTIFGWQVTIVIFIAVLSLRYARVYNQNERLTFHLREEVGLRTNELKDVNTSLSQLNEQLQKDRYRSEVDLEMASRIQKKFFQQPVNSFIGWELAICYQPLSKVSGDLYDYYTYGLTLNGLSLFDVSGHGISAGLITMLSKNIISHTFQRGFTQKEPIPAMLHKINSTLIKEKGKIDNYLTGIICRFREFNEDDSVHVELGNAGHPYPILYSAENDRTITLVRNNGMPRYGAIGMAGIQPEFSEVNFIMNVDDIFVLYTDGVTETSNPEGEQFGLPRLEHLISEYHEKSAEEIIKVIKQSLNDFAKDKPREDDVTIVVLKRKSSSDIPEIDEDIEELIPEDEEE